MLDVYWRWLRFGATAKELSTLLLFGFIGSELCSIGAQVWVGHWAEVTSATAAAATTAAPTWECIPVDGAVTPALAPGDEKNSSSVQRVTVADMSPCGPHEQAVPLAHPDPQEGIVWYIGIYALLSLGAVAIYFWRNWRWATNVVRAAAQLHERLLLNVLRCAAMFSPLSLINTPRSVLQNVGHWRPCKIARNS